MRILVIGGTGFIGPHLVRRLSQMGHSVSVFHRGKTEADLPAQSILGERRDLVAIRPKADVVIDLILSSGAQAESLMEAFTSYPRPAGLSENGTRGLHDRRNQRASGA